MLVVLGGKDDKKEKEGVKKSVWGKLKGRGR